jgi:hypothetical protein
MLIGRMLVVTLAVLGVPSSGAQTAPPAIHEVYDKTKQVTVQGMLIGSASPRPPYSVYLLISTKDSKDRIVQWAIEGDTIDQLHKHGYKDDKVRMGETVTVKGHPKLAGQRPEDRIPKPVRGALERAFALAKEGRLILGTEITVPDGTKVPFGQIK